MLIIDRFEGDYAVVEDGDKVINIRREFIEDSAEEGDVLAVVDTFYVVDRAETEKRREETAEMMRKLKGKG